MKSIFVTGGAGFIGSHTCLFLLQKGYVIFILDSLVNSSEKQIEKLLIILKNQGIEIKEKIYLIKGDLKNQGDILEKEEQIISKENEILKKLTSLERKINKFRK